MVMSEFRHTTTSFFHCTPLLMIAVQAKSMQCVGSKPFVIVANYCIHWLSKGSTGKIQCPEENLATRIN